MILEITEEEREFLERACIRAEMLEKKNLGQRSFERDRRAIKALMRKLEKKDDC